MVLNNNLVIIVGSGVTGLTLAERFANIAKRKVLIVEKRNHIGGNCYDFVNKKGILVSKYGPHIFHTKSEKVWRYINKFADWERYEHRVLSSVGGVLVPIPVNVETINNLFGAHLRNGKEMEEWLSNKRVALAGKALNGRDVVVSKLGSEIYRLLFREYSKKQWDNWPEELEPEVLLRIPVRYSFDDRYYDDKYQCRPVGGYTKMMERMSKNPNIQVKLKTDYFDVYNQFSKDCLVIFTGPVDEYVSRVMGIKKKLPYRSIKFVWKSYNKEYFQPIGVINYPSMIDKMVRVTEYKHLTGQKHRHTTVSEEYFKWGGEPYYPVLTPKSRRDYLDVEKLSRKFKNVYFAGRLGKYRYINMDTAIKEALELFREITKNEKAK